jgi:pilus assembly protein CpaB
MNHKMIPLISIAAGILAFALTFKYLVDKDREIDKMKQEIMNRARMVSVVAAQIDIPGETTLKMSDIATVPVIEATASDQIIREDDYKLILGKKTLFQIKKGRPILWSDIKGSELAGRGLSASVKPDWRAVSIAVSGAAAVSGMVEPNDHVDVLGTFSLPSKGGGPEMETVTVTVLQNVTILATGQDMPRGLGARRTTGRNSNYSTVTLEVLPREAELLVFAQQMQGRLSLALRNMSDVSTENDPSEVDFAALKAELPELNQKRQQRLRLRGEL